jgi:hypothetical protein
MTKAKISEYDAVAANNTDVNGVNIDEGCAPSGMNNMGREIMAALKRFETGADGDSLTVGGNLIVSGTVTAANTATLGNVDVNGGTIDGAVIGGASAAAVSATTLNTSGAVVFNDAGADVDFRVEGDTDANLLFVDAGNDRVGIGIATPSDKLTVRSGTNNVAANVTVGDNLDRISLGWILDTATINLGQIPAQILQAGVDLALVARGDFASNMLFYTSAGATAAERVRITSGGELLVGKTVVDLNTEGNRIGDGFINITRDQGQCLACNRLTDDGTLVEFFQAGVLEGTISVSGTTVSYNGGNLSRWAQLTTPKDDTPLLKGTVMSNLDEMNVYIAPTTYWTEEDELPEGVNVGDVKEAEHEVENEQLNKVKVSDVEGDANVAGVFVNWTYDEAHQVDEINMAMTGDMIIRIAEGVTVARGDLLMSAGNGTAKPQGDDIVRSKTIAKVTSTHVTCTYEDGSYCVPCVLMAC